VKRMTLPVAFLVLLGATISGPGNAWAEITTQSGLSLRNLAASRSLEPGLLCREAISATERGANIPAQLMAAIARIESGRPNAQGVVHPWPWTINAEGEGHYYATKGEAVAAARAMQARGVRSMDVGCMQVNLMHHPNAFASLDQAFDPQMNAAYAARFLNQLFAQTGDWAKATANYHSATPDIGASYERKVAMVLPEEQKRGGSMLAGLGANGWATNPNAGSIRGTGWPSQAGTLAPAAMSAGAVGGGYMLSNKMNAARVFAAPQGTAGRGLAAYRAAPIPVASRQNAGAILQIRNATR
jgi:Transglycosylase SLT domain